jgi:hypothetical protein
MSRTPVSMPKGCNRAGAPCRGRNQAPPHEQQLPYSFILAMANHGLEGRRCDVVMGHELRHTRHRSGGEVLRDPLFV